LDEPLAAAIDEDLDPVAMEDGTMSDAVINFDECSGFLWHLEEPWLLEYPASDFLEVLCALEHSAGFFFGWTTSSSNGWRFGSCSHGRWNNVWCSNNFDECSGFLWHLEEPWHLDDPA
jgi:hypothetical protein